MRTANYQNDLLNGIAALLSINPGANLSPEMAAQWTSFINTRVKYAWGYYAFPELMVTQERAFRPIWRSDQNWFAGDEVAYLPNIVSAQATTTAVNAYFRAITEVPQGPQYGPAGAQGASFWVPLTQNAFFTDLVTIAGNATVTSATASFNQGDVNQIIGISSVYFPSGTTISSVTNATTAVLSSTALLSGTGISFTIQGRTTGLDKFVAYDQSGQQPIGEVYGVYNFNPRLRPWLTVPGLYFMPSERGIDVAPFSGNSVFLWYKIIPSQFTSVPFVTGTTYFYGQTVFWPTDGNCYQCGVEVTTTDPTDPTSWFIIQLPLFMLDYVKTAAASDAADDLRTTQLLEKQALDYLDREIEKLEAQGHAYLYTLRKPQRVWLPYGISGFWWSAVTPWQGSFVTTLTDALYTPIPPSRAPTWVDEADITVVDESGNPILVPT